MSGFGPRAPPARAPANAHSNTMTRKQHHACWASNPDRRPAGVRNPDKLPTSALRKPQNLPARADTRPTRGGQPQSTTNWLRPSGPVRRQKRSRSLARPTLRESPERAPTGKVPRGNRLPPAAKHRTFRPGGPSLRVTPASAPNGCRPKGNRLPPAANHSRALLELHPGRRPWVPRWVTPKGEPAPAGGEAQHLSP